MVIARVLCFVFPVAMCMAGEAPDKTAPVAPAPAAPVPVKPVAPAVPQPRASRPRVANAIPPLNTAAAAPAETPADIKDFSNSKYCIDLAQVHLRYNAIERAEEMLGKAVAASKDKNEKVQANMLLAN